MTEKRMTPASDDAAARVAEIAGLFVSIRQTLEFAREALEASDASQTKTILNKLNEIQSAHVKVLAAEDAFHAQHAAADADDLPDLDAIRAEIGRKLDGIRAVLDAGGVSGGAE